MATQEKELEQLLQWESKQKRVQVTQTFDDWVDAVARGMLLKPPAVKSCKNIPQTCICPWARA